MQLPVLIYTFPFAKSLEKSRISAGVGSVLLLLSFVNIFNLHNALLSYHIING